MTRRQRAHDRTTDRPTPAERQRVLFDWNRTGTPRSEVCLHQLVEAAARCFPDAPAVISNGETVLYDELTRRANRLAGHLRQSAIREGSIVALYLPRSPDLIVAQLGVLEAGAAYLSIDRAHPPERRRSVLADARPSLVITLRALAGDLDTSIRVLQLEDVADPTAAIGAGSGSAGRPGSLAYVTYTSGSTGQPKGVLIPHRGAVNYIAQMIARRQLQAGDRALQSASLSFDGSVRDTVGVLAFGGTIILLDDERAHDPLALLAAIRDQGVTVILTIVPTMLRALACAALEEDLAGHTLRLIMVGGEPLLRTDVERTRQAFGPGVQIVNQYGATECSMATTNYTVPAELPAAPASLPVGRPIANTRIYILDQDHGPVPLGTEGDLYIGGMGVSWGYLNQPALTAERFLPDPYSILPDGRMYCTGDRARHLPDGSVLYVGRADQQVKIRGNRVELGEIESVLREHPALREAAVLLGEGAGRKVLTAYITLNHDTTPGELREFLATRVPFHMLPASFVVLDALPLTRTGKVDRQRLPRPRGRREGGPLVPARTMVEAQLVSLWESVLGVDQVGVADDFFELGGDSLMAARLFELIEREFGDALPLQVLFQHGTVETLAKLLENEAGRTRLGVIPLQPRGARTPLFMIPAYLYLRDFALCFAPDRPVYGLQTGTPYTSAIEEEALAHYRNLVAFHPDGPYLLLGHSAGGYIALEVARLLVGSGKQVDFLGLIDTFPPGRRRQAAPFERLQLHLENLQGRGARDAVDYSIQLAKRLAVRAMRYVPGRRRLVSVFACAGAEQWAEQLAVQNYAPEPFPGNVTLFVARERPWYVRWDPMQRWSRSLTGHMEIVAIDGEHMSAIRPPRAASLAQKMKSLFP